MLRLERLECGYGAFRAVHGLDLEIEAGSLHALIGANGAGKTSTLMAVAGHVEVQSGRICLDGAEITTRPARDRVRAGIGLCPEGRRLFPDLSVEENLVVGGYSRPRARAARRREWVYALFPRLAGRRRQSAGSLSGGEQQMLALGRALMAEPRLLLVDELSLGLMPAVIERCYEVLAGLRAEGLTVLLVEQSTARALAVADRVTVLESGRCVWQGDAGAARGDAALIEAYLGMGEAVAEGAA